jgi:hypothetical protein
MTGHRIIPFLAHSVFATYAARVNLFALKILTNFKKNCIHNLTDISETSQRRPMKRDENSYGMDELVLIP